nr:DNA helicase B-like isoform X2 [Lytechinus pictus]
MPLPKQGKQDGKDLPTVKISGYFPRYNSSESRPQGRPNDEDEDNYIYDEDDFNEFNEDFECISTPTRERTMIKKGGKNKEIKVKGKFLLDGPWFIISFDAILVNNVYHVQGTPTYSLRMEMGKNGEAILDKLLRYALGFPSPGDQRKEAFLTYFNQCRSKNKVKNFTFNQFFKALEEALKMEVDPDSERLMQAAKTMIDRFDPFNKCCSDVPHDREKEEEKKQSKFDLRYVYRCYKCPVLFRVLPLLMEREALAILSTDRLSDLEELELVLKNSPEDLGFYTTMQKHGWGGLEASFQGFVKAGLIPANFFKCTQDSTQQGPSSKPPSNQKCNHDKPSTSTAHQDNAGTSSSRQTKRPLPLSVTMALILKIYDLVKFLCREGKHTFVKDKMMRKAWHRDDCPNVPFDRIKEDHFVELQKREVVTIEKIPQTETMYHWTKYRRYEEKIARALVSDLLHQTVTNQSTPPTEEFSEFNLDEYQLPAVMHMWKSPVSIILGRGGCGKTHVVASFVTKFLEDRENKMKLEIEKAAQEGNQKATDEASDGEEKEEKDKEEDESNDNRNRVRIEAMDEPLVLLTAPTGRAASIIGRRTGLKAKTLHSVSGTARMSEPEYFIYKKVEILVVDECSLVPISVLSGVLSTLLRHSLKKVIFLGDPHQLPSIDPGNFLQDIIKVFKKTNSDCIHTLKKNHRTDEGGRLINENSRKIAEEKRSDLQFQPDMFESLDTSARQAGNGLDQTIKTLLESKPQLKDDRNSQFVAFRNVDVKDINGICCRRYAAHAPYKKGGRLDLHIHDKICARKNGTIVVHGEYDPKAKEKKKKEREGDGEAGSSKDNGDDSCRIRRINNGDTFFIKNWRVEEEKNKRRDIVTLQSLDEEEGKVFEVDLRDLIRKFKIEYAWARTINTYQVSSFPVILRDVLTYALVSPVCQMSQQGQTRQTFQARHAELPN